MPKLIVDAPKLGAGQTYGSGGVREIGSANFVALFKNPRPYNESSQNTLSNSGKALMFTAGALILADACYQLWDGLGKPLLKKGLTKIQTHLESRTTSKNGIQNNTKETIEPDSKTELNNYSIPFSKRKVI